MADKDNDSSPVPERRRKWFIGGAVVLALAVIALLVGSNIPSSFIPNKQAEPSSPTTNSATGIAAGSGGTEVGADGVTMIGYEPTCDGAVRAATNYLKALESVHVVSDDKYKALLDQIVLPGSYKEYRLEQLRIASGEGEDNPASKKLVRSIKQVVHPKWGGAYKVKSCEPEAAAVVGVFPCTYTAPFTVEGQKAPASIDCQSRQVSLRWTDGDWKVADIGGSDASGDEVILTGDNADAVPQDPDKMPLSEELRERFLVNLKTDKPLKGWVDYANVNRN